MRVVNQTSYDTRTMRKLLTAAYAAVRKYEQPASWWRRLTVTIEYGKRVTTETSGFAYLHGGPMTLRVPRAAASQQGFAETAAHELMHCYGYRHGEFYDATLAAVLPDLPGEIPSKPVRPVVKIDPRASRYARVLELEKSWTRKLKLAQTKLRKLRDRRKYYEQTLPAAAREALRAQ